MSGAVPPIIVLANSGSFETKTQCMSILQRMLLGRAMPDEVRKCLPPVTCFSVRRAQGLGAALQLDTRQKEGGGATEKPFVTSHYLSSFPAGFAEWFTSLSS